MSLTGTRIRLTQAVVRNRVLTHTPLLERIMELGEFTASDVGSLLLASRTLQYAPEFVAAARQHVYMSQVARVKNVLASFHTTTQALLMTEGDEESSIGIPYIRKAISELVFGLHGSLMQRDPHDMLEYLWRDEIANERDHLAISLLVMYSNSPVDSVLREAILLMYKDVFEPVVELSPDDFPYGIIISTVYFNIV